MTKQTSTETPAGTGKGRWRRWLKRIGITLAVLAVASLGVIGVAEHETSKPEFCGSCHIMEDYHESWQADLHGAKLDIACVECHYAPGERTTLNAKLRGLSQVTSYFSGRYGATRPRAHVSNDSCMTAKCHGDLTFMDQEISIGTVKFTHAKHLQYDDAKRQKNQADLEELAAAFKQTLDGDQFAQLERVAREAGPAPARLNAMAALTAEWNAAITSEQLEKFSQLNHRQVRTAQLADLQCTNCHTYSTRDVDGEKGKSKHHFSVSTTSCYTCHFNNEGFNTGTTNCLMCHSLPSEAIVVHEELSPQEGEKLESPELTTKSVAMNHQEILERKVNCIACHADVATEDSLVTRRDCERCHDQPRFFEDWQDVLQLDTVQRYHKLHIPQQRAKCLDCHTEIHHELVRADDKAAGHVDFITSAMSDCRHCHPNQHLEQINLLRGVGGTGGTTSTPNMMFGSRTNCYGCHTEAGLGGHGGEVLKAGLSGCVACHGDKHNDTFERWKLGLQIVTMDAEEAYASAKKMLDETADAPPQARAEAQRLLTAAESDLKLVKRGNGLHNVTYSIDLLDSVTRRCQQAMAELAKKGGDE